MNLISSLFSLFKTSSIEKLKQGSIPTHVAIIMDGNGRWASRRNLPRVMGHKAGVEALRKIIKVTSKLEIKYLTVFSFSSENWNRPKNEVEFLMDLFIDCLNNEIPLLNKNGVRVKLIGKREGIPEKVLKSFEKSEQVTRENKKMIFNIAFNYGSRQEIVEAAKNMCRQAKQGKLNPEDINLDTFSKFLHTWGCPDPDLVIRTSGEYRISNFLLWQSAYTEFYFTKTLWPDFGQKHYLKAISDYQRRNRRFGRV